MLRHKEETEYENNMQARCSFKRKKNEETNIRLLFTIPSYNKI